MNKSKIIHIQKQAFCQEPDGTISFTRKELTNLIKYLKQKVQ